MAKTKNIKRTITFITGNKHKVKEAQGILNNLGIALEHTDLGYPAFSMTYWVFRYIS